MTKQVWLAVVLLLTFTLGAWAQEQTTTNTTETTTTTTTSTDNTTAARRARGRKASATAEGTSLQGCLAKSGSGEGYVLTNRNYASGVAVVSTSGADLAAHVGHHVRLTGAWDKPANADQNTAKRFNVTKITHLASTCGPGGDTATGNTRGSRHRGAAANNTTTP